MVATSPSQFSVGSSISISSISSPNTDNAAAAPDLPNVRNVAQSVHVTDGVCVELCDGVEVWGCLMM